MFTKINFFTNEMIHVSILRLSSTDDRADLIGEESPGFIGQGAG